MSDMSLVMPIRRTNLKLALLLAAAGTLAGLALLPYLLALMLQKPAALPMPLGVFLLLQTLQAGVLCGLLAGSA